MRKYMKNLVEGETPAIREEISYFVIVFGIYRITFQDTLHSPSDFTAKID